MKLKVKKKELCLFFGFVFLFTLFACFQNFEMITDVEKQIGLIPEQAMDQAAKVQKKIFSVRFFRPYFFKDHIGSLETPEGFTASIAPRDGRIIFDEKKYIDDKWRASPLYNSTKDYLDFSTADTQNSPAPCSRDPAAKYNNCFANYNSSGNRSPSGMKFRANPLRKTASISYGGNIDSQLLYDENERSVDLELSKKLNPRSNVNFEMKSQDQSEQINIDWKW